MNYTGMDIFDRGLEPMCYCVNDDSGRRVVKANAWNNVNLTKAVSALTSFSCWNIRRSDLLTLSPIVLKRDDGRRVEPLYYGGRI